MSFNNPGRQSPFKRQNSVSPGTTGQSRTPTQSPTKFQPSLSPEKASPFVRRPSQLNNSGPDRPTSPFARPTGLPAPASPSRNTSNASSVNEHAEALSGNRQRSTTPNIVPIVEANSKVPSSPSPFDGTATGLEEEIPSPLKPGNFQPAASHISKTPTQPQIRPPTFGRPKATFAPAAGPYSHIAPGLLRSMRESFEVLDSSNSGSITSASVAPILSQVGLETDPRTFFPSNQPPTLNLAKYLDVLSGPLTELSSLEEMAAAFGAFDVDDSGQIDLAELRRALLETPPEAGEEGFALSEREVDGILGQFAWRRAFGGKGLGATAAKGRGEVFKYREFMANVGGGVADVGGDGQAISA